MFPPLTTPIKTFGVFYLLKWCFCLCFSRGIIRVFFLFALFFFSIDGVRASVVGAGGLENHQNEFSVVGAGGRKITKRIFSRRSRWAEKSPKRICSRRSRVFFASKQVGKKKFSVVGAGGRRLGASGREFSVVGAGGRQNRQNEFSVVGAGVFSLEN